MSENRDYRDYDEKGIQKQEEKTEEKSAEEKSYDEKYRSDPVGMVVWAAILIWAGLVLLANNLNLLDRLQIRAGDVPFDLPFDVNAWSLFFLGAGVLVLLGIAARLVFPSYRRPIMGSLIWAIVLFGIALGSWELIWPLILIAIGLSILFGGFFRGK